LSGQEGRACRAMPLKLSVGLLLLFCGNAGSQDRDDPKDLLLHARQTVLDTVRRLPRYVCTVTIDRTRYEATTPEYLTNGRLRTRSCDDTIAEMKRAGRVRRPSSSDRLRFVVAVKQDTPGVVKEMYSWAGEDRFDDRDLLDFVRDGAISTGTFSSMLASIFGGDAARFFYSGDSSSGGRLLSEFSFSVPEEKSRYRYVFGDSALRQTPIAYDGAAFIDPETSDLVRMAIRSRQLPPETGACELTQFLEYDRVRLNGSDFLLPAEARVSVLRADGTEAENRIGYSACREFLGASTVRFGPPAADAASASRQNAPPPPFPLPAGLPFKVIFTDQVDAATGAAGDPIHGRLKTAIRDRADKVLVPAGTPVTARILKVRRFYAQQRPPVAESRGARNPSLVLEVRLQTLEIGGTSQAFKAAFDSGLRRFPKQQSGPFAVRVDIGSIGRPEDSGNDREIGTFEFWDPSPGFIVKAGLESNWVTLAP